MLLALVLACSAPAPSSPEPAPAPVTEPVAEHMQEHFAMGSIGIEAWVAGEFGTAQERLEKLAEHQAPSSLADDKEHLEAMRSAASAAAAGGPPAKVAGSLADLGAACGSCHAAKGVEPAIDRGQPPAASDERIAHMRGHQWAVETLWASLVANDAELWARGATKLADAPLGPDGFGEPALPGELLAHEGSVHSAVERVKSASTADEKRAAFVAVATACTDCHLVVLGE